jgi:uncharacterized protein
LPRSDSYAAAALSGYRGKPIRVMFISDLGNHEQNGWQVWLASQYKARQIVTAPDRNSTDLAVWATQIHKVLTRSSPETTWIAVAHGFGCLALAHYLDAHMFDPVTPQARVKAAVLVAPTDPAKFHLAHRIPQSGLGIPSAVIGSENDPWMPLHQAQDWAAVWGSKFHNLGQAGHIDAAAGFGVWSLARYKVDELIRDQQRQRRMDRAHPLELSYAV